MRRCGAHAHVYEDEFAKHPMLRKSNRVPCDVGALHTTQAGDRGREQGTHVGTLYAIVQEEQHAKLTRSEAGKGLGDREASRDSDHYRTQNRPETIREMHWHWR